MRRLKFKYCQGDHLPLIETRKPILIKHRASTITPKYLNKVVLIFNGQKYTKKLVVKNMLGYKFGAFSLTRKRHTFKTKLKK